MGERSGWRGKYRQAVAAKSGEWSTGSSTSSGEEDKRARRLEAGNKELGARIDAFEKKDGMQVEANIPAKEGGDLEDVWRDCMEIEDEAENCRRVDDQRKKMYHTLQCGFIEHRTLVSHNSLSKSAQYLRSSFKLV